MDPHNIGNTTRKAIWCARLLCGTTACMVLVVFRNSPTLNRPAIGIHIQIRYLKLSGVMNIHGVAGAVDRFQRLAAVDGPGVIGDGPFIDERLN